LYFLTICGIFSERPISERMTTEDAKGRRTSQREQPRPPGRSRRLIHVLLVFVAAVLVIDALVGERGLLAMLETRREFAELSADLTRARGENARLREQARRLREEPDAIEEIARRELGLIKPGETLFIIKDVERPR
jgi:cell division protein FtsB